MSLPSPQCVICCLQSVFYTIKKGLGHSCPAVTLQYAKQKINDNNNILLNPTSIIHISWDMDHTLVKANFTLKGGTVFKPQARCI